MAAFLTDQPKQKSFMISSCTNQFCSQTSVVFAYLQNRALVVLSGNSQDSLYLHIRWGSYKVKFGKASKVLLSRKHIWDKKWFCQMKGSRNWYRDGRRSWYISFSWNFCTLYIFAHYTLYILYSVHFCTLLGIQRVSLVVQIVKNLPAMQETWVPSLGWEDPLEKGKATHFSILDWEIPWTENAGRLQSIGSQIAGHNQVMNTFTSLSTFSITGIFPLLTVISFSALHFPSEGITALFWHFWNNGRHFECRSNSNGIKRIISKWDF